MYVSEVYQVKAILVLKNNETIDISSYVKSIDILLSLRIPIPTFTVTIYNLRILVNEIKELDLEIDTIQHSKNIHYFTKFSLILQHQTRFFGKEMAFTDIVKQTYTSSNYPVPLVFYLKSIYNSVNYIHKPYTGFNVQILDVVKSIMPPSIKKLDTSNLSNEIIYQVYLKSQPFLTSLIQLNWLYGFSDSATSIAFIQEDSNSECVLRIRNIHKDFKQQKYDKEIIVINPSFSPTNYSNTKTVAVTDINITNNSKKILPRTFTLINKPLDTISNKTDINYTNLINQHSATYKSFNPDTNEVTEKQHLYSHIGLNNSNQPVLSMLAYEYMFNNHILVSVYNQLVPIFTWPSDMVKLQVNDPEKISSTGGLFLCESNHIRISKKESMSWKIQNDISLVRSNIFGNENTTLQKPTTIIKNTFSSKKQQQVNKSIQKLTDINNFFKQSKNNISDAKQNISSNLEIIADNQKVISDISNFNDMIKQNAITQININDSISNLLNNLDHLNKNLSDLSSNNNNIVNNLKQLQISSASIADLENNIKELKFYLYPNSQENNIGIIYNLLLESKESINNIKEISNNVLDIINTLPQGNIDNYISQLNNINYTIQNYNTNLKNHNISKNVYKDLLNSKLEEVYNINNQIINFNTTMNNKLNNKYTLILSFLNSFNISSVINSISTKVLENFLGGV